MSTLHIYTDGGCAPTNPGKGACAYALVKDDELIRSEVYTSLDSTSNIMELTAVLKALQYCDKHYSDHEILLYTDSMYVQQSITKWAHAWKQNNWLNTRKKPIANRELWIDIIDLYQKLNLKCYWVKAHSGNPWNEFVDKLCANKPK